VTKKKVLILTPGADCLDVSAVEIGVLDVVEQGVAPVKSVALVVHREAIGPAQQDVLEDLDIGAVGVSPGDVGWPVPLGEEDEALVGVNDDGSGTLQVLEQRPAVGDVSGAQNVQRALPAVDVVEVLGRPVDGETLDALVLGSQNVFAGGAVFLDAVDDVQNDVGVVDVVAVGVEVETDESGRPGDDRNHRVGEAGRDRVHDLALDEFLLRVHQEVVNVFAALQVGAELVADLAGALVAELAL